MAGYCSVNPELLDLAWGNISKHAKQAGEKQAFIPGGPPPGDPAAGGAPPGGPPMDPAAMGGAPAGPPPEAGSDPTAGMTGAMPDLSNIIQQQVQAAIQGMGGAGGGAGGEAQVKPKIDQNVVMLQILKMLAKIADSLGVHVPASEMVTTPEDLQQMAQGGPVEAAATPDDAAGQGGGQGLGSAISPVEPMQPASPELAKQGALRVGSPGRAFDTRGLGDNLNKAAAIAMLRSRRNGRAV